MPETLQRGKLVKFCSVGKWQQMSETTPTAQPIYSSMTTQTAQEGQTMWSSWNTGMQAGPNFGKPLRQHFISITD